MSGRPKTSKTTGQPVEAKTAHRKINIGSFVILGAVAGCRVLCKLASGVLFKPEISRSLSESWELADHAEISD